MKQIVIGRYREKQLMDDALNSERSELLAVYWRRRIGKTYLIREYLAKYIIFSVTGLSSDNRDAQLKNFMLKLQEINPKK